MKASIPAWLRALPVLGALLAPGCDDDSARGVDPVEVTDVRDLEPVEAGKFDGALAVFDADLLFDDATFTDTDAVTVAAVQGLLESTPYGSRSFLADEVVRGEPFSKVLVDVAAAKQLNPILLLVRLQVEKSLVSKATRPSGNAVDFALGCGCADGKACNEAYRGLDAQLSCAAGTLRTHFDGSVAGSGAWRLGVAKKTLDPQSVVPGSHGTAALYAYTPWVLEDEGGNWLVWNISRKYIAALVERGAWNVGAEPADADAASCADRCGSTSAMELGDGQACFCDASCVDNGDCCGDYVEVCGAPSDDAPDDLPPTGGSCIDACGSGDPMTGSDGSVCYCDEHCATNGDCCADLDAACS